MHLNLLLSACSGMTYRSDHQEQEVCSTRRHPQADTASKGHWILKKRCQMMGLEVANCSELERDFLIRYANAVSLRVR